MTVSTGVLIAVALGLGVFIVAEAMGSDGGGGSAPPAPAPVGGALPDSVAQAIAGAISQQEGYGVPGATPTVNNNPGDLRNWGGGYPTDSRGFTIFPDYATGYAALVTDIQNHAAANPDESIEDWIATYAPASDGNNPAAYAAAVAAAVGVDPSTTFSQLAVMA